MAEKKKARRHLIRAKLFRTIKADPLSFFDAKSAATVEGINNMILEQPEYQKALNDNIVADYKVDLLFNVVQGLNQRKAALENAVKLHGQNYFSQPRVDDHSEAQKIVDNNKKRRARRKRKTNNG